MMDWRNGYMVASAIYQSAMWIAAAYFHNGWSVVFILLAVVASFSLSNRIEEWK